MDIKDIGERTNRLVIDYCSTLFRNEIRLKKYKTN